LDGGGFVVVDVEDWEEMRYFQSCAEVGRNVGELQMAAAIANRGEGGDQFAKSGVAAIADVA
jgi:hypothetical protein